MSENKDKTRVAIIFGGPSSEHDVSLMSATNICNAVNLDLYEIVLLGIDKNGVWHYNSNYANRGINLLETDFFESSTSIRIGYNGKIIDDNTGKILDQFQIAFPIIHGAFGEDGTLQGFLKTLQIPLVGSGILGSAICMDKDIAKRLLRDAGIPIAKYILVRRGEEAINFDIVSKYLGLPVFIKPANAGSSVGVSKVKNETEYLAALELSFLHDKKILVEEAVIGKEIECAILGNENPEASVLGEIIPKKDFYTIDAKYQDDDGAVLNIPADINLELSEELRQAALKAFIITECQGLARVDFFLRRDSSYVLNEINTLPGFTKNSMYPKLWEYSDKRYTEIISILINLALKNNFMVNRKL